MDAVVLVTPHPANKHSPACDGSCDGRPEVKEEKASKAERQAGEEAGNIRNQNKQPQHAGTMPPCVVTETPRMSQAWERVLGWSVRRRVHVGCKFPVGPASRLLDGPGFRREVLPLVYKSARWRAA